MHYDVPAYWKGSPTQIFGQHAEIPYPHYTDELDYELEIGFIVGRHASDLTPEAAKAAPVAKADLAPSKARSCPPRKPVRS